MMMNYITLEGFFLAVFGTGVAVGQIVEKIERLTTGLVHRVADPPINVTLGV